MNYTFYLCFGDYAGFHVEWTKKCKRIVLGKLAIALVSYDVEILVSHAVEEIKELRLTLKEIIEDGT
jgi:hypothetical protein